jgi:hypothetical protein
VPPPQHNRSPLSAPAGRLSVRLLRTAAAEESAVAVRQGNVVPVHVPPPVVIIAYASHNLDTPEAQLTEFMQSDMFAAVRLHDKAFSHFWASEVLSFQW